MATSQNGWAAYSSYSDPNLTPFPWVSGKVRAGDVRVVLDHVARFFHENIEPIDKAQSWGFAPRDIRGPSTQLSNHASGTAADFNAQRHPRGKRGTFTPDQVRRMDAFLTTLDGVVRWGEHYPKGGGVVDGMHFEINRGPAQVAAVAARIRAGNTHTVSEEDDDMPKAIIFTSTRQGGKSLYVAFPNAREYDYIESEQERDDYRNILTRQGFAVENWRNNAGTNEVGNPDVFGRYVGPPTFKPTNAKREAA